MTIHTTKLFFRFSLRFCMTIHTNLLRLITFPHRTTHVTCTCTRHIHTFACTRHTNSSHPYITRTHRMHTLHAHVTRTMSHHASYEHVTRTLHMHMRTSHPHVTSIHHTHTSHAHAHAQIHRFIVHRSCKSCDLFLTKIFHSKSQIIVVCKM